MKIALLLAYTAGVVAAGDRAAVKNTAAGMNAGKTSSIHPDTIQIFENNRKLLGFGYVERTTNGNGIHGSLRSRSENPFGHEALEEAANEEAFQNEMAHMQPYHGSTYGGRSSKKDATYDDDYYDSMEDDYYMQEDDHYYDDSGKGKGSKSSKGGKGSKSRGKGDKKSKKGKSSKSKVHQKLKDPSHPEDDDYVYTEDDYYVNSYGDDEYWAYDPWATPAPSSVENMMDGEESVTARTGIANREDATATPTQAPPAVGDSIVVTSRSGSNPTSEIQTVQAMEEVVEESLGPATIGAPKVQRELFPDPVQLKAHSSVHLQEHDPEFFAETSSFLTPCLQQAYEGSLQAYKLTVDYSDGPDASAHGVIITHMEIHTVISVVTDTIEELKSITHDSATKVLHDCFDGGKLYQYLGSLRREGVEINEIEFQDRPFKSPIFGNGEPVGIISNGGSSSPVSEPKKSRAGLIATLTIGMVVVGVVLLAHRRGKLPAVQIPTDRIGHLAKSIRNPFKGEKVGRMSRAFRDRFHSSFNSSDQAVVAGLSDSSQSSNNDSSGGEYKPRERSWSGSLRRYPEGSVRPAALQKQPAKSSDYLRSPMPSPRTDVSYSVAGDYNVPEEYDFQATPVSSAYSSALVPKRALSTTSSKSVEEFSMPEDYNTVHEDMSLYSRNTNMLGGRAGGSYPPVRTPTSRASRAEDAYSRQSTSPQRMMGLNNNSLLSPAESKSAASSCYEGSSQTKEPYIDEWSVASFQTSSPPGAAPAVGTTEALSPPYRHWNEKPKDSPGSRLAMPRLS